jgi:hypothetical protein
MGKKLVHWTIQFDAAEAQLLLQLTSKAGVSLDAAATAGRLYAKIIEMGKKLGVTVDSAPPPPSPSPGK